MSTFLSPLRPLNHLYASLTFLLQYSVYLYKQLMSNSYTETIKYVKQITSTSTEEFDWDAYDIPKGADFDIDLHR